MPTGTSGEAASADLFLLGEANSAPVARDMEFTTYKNVAVTERFDGVDPEGDLLTYPCGEKARPWGCDDPGGRDLRLYTL